MGNFTRFFIGCYFPVLLEILIYETYLYLKPTRQPDFMLLIYTIPVILPLIFFYFISPYIIFRLSSAGEKYSTALDKSIEEIFISEKNVLDPKEISIVKQELEATLIPELVRNFRSDYVNTYFSQSHPNEAEEYSVLNYYEEIFLFSLFASFFSFINALVTLYLHFDNLVFGTIFIADKIYDIFNVLLFFSIMLTLGIIGTFLLVLLRRRITIYISMLNPGWVNFSNNKEAQLLQIKAISDFNFDDILSDSLINTRGFMTNLYLDLLREKITKVVVSATREQVGKQLTWKIYSNILTELNIEEKKKTRLEQSFLSSPLIKTAQQFAFNKKEAESLQEDFSYFNTTIENWDSQGDSEKLSAFLLLYRSAESLFRGILRTRGLDTGNFGAMLISLADLGLLKNDEQIILNQVRRHRNYILHRAGEKITIQKKFAEDFIRVVENILIRADNLEIEEEGLEQK